MFKFWRRKREDVHQETQPEAALVSESHFDAEKPGFLGTLFTPKSKQELDTSEQVSQGSAIEQSEVQSFSDKADTGITTDDAMAEEQVLEPEPNASEVMEVELPKRRISGIRALFGQSINLEELEDILLRADFGVETAEEISNELKKLAQQKGASSDAEVRLILKDLLAERLKRSDSALKLSDAKLPYVILVVGVNGAGKTTTIGKLAKWLSDGEWKVVLGAADTFRAAAVQQLATWAQRSESVIVSPDREGQDPASVAYQTVERAVSDAADIAIIDTAGRLQNKKDLMDELSKIRRAVEKLAQVNEVLLVIDASTGQNGLSQARAFTEVASVTGIVMTKLDGSAKGGILYSLQRELDIPIKLVGVGEGINDFAFFDAEEFALGLVSQRA